MNSKGQTVSTDVLIAIALFLIVITFFFSVGLDVTEERKVRELGTQNSNLLNSLSGTKNATGSLIQGSKIDEQTLNELSGLKYDDLKDALGVAHDFCIYFEDNEGNLVTITKRITGLGSGLVSVGNDFCGAELNAAEIIICEEAEIAVQCSRVDELGITQQECCTFAGACCS